MSDFELRTARLVLRPWREEDRAPFATMNADPAVMEFFPALLDAQRSDQMIEVFETEFAVRGFCPWATERSEDGAFLGFVGLHGAPDAMTFAPAVEVGWRLAQPYWGQGYASEAAHAALAYGFDTIGLDEIVSFTAVLNKRSQAVMQRIGMTSDPAENFDHPRIERGHRLVPHVLYRLARADWQNH